MSELRFLTIAEQVAAYLREELRCGRWGETLPGKHSLAEELGINNKTVETALRQLEQEGVLVGQGPGRRRRIVVPDGGFDAPQLRVAIFDFDPPERTEQWIVAMRQQLLDQGHRPFFVGKSLTELGMDLQRVVRLVKRTSADVWVVCAASREILEWFAEQEMPVFSLFGTRWNLPIAGTGPDKTAPLAEATRRLIELGHHRISFLARGLPEIAPGTEWRQSIPWPSVRAFLEELENAGISTGRFNVPEWKSNREGFENHLNSLFGATSTDRLDTRRTVSVSRSLSLSCPAWPAGSRGYLADLRRSRPGLRLVPPLGRPCELGLPAGGATCPALDR